LGTLWHAQPQAEQAEQRPGECERARSADGHLGGAQTIATGQFLIVGEWGRDVAHVQAAQ